MSDRRTAYIAAGPLTEKLNRLVGILEDEGRPERANGVRMALNEIFLADWYQRTDVKGKMISRAATYPKELRESPDFQVDEARAMRRELTERLGDHAVKEGLATITEGEADRPLWPGEADDRPKMWTLHAAFLTPMRRQDFRPPEGGADE